MHENILRQQSAFLKTHGVAMTTSELRHTVSTVLALQTLYYEDPISEARVEFNDPDFWRDLSPGNSADPTQLAFALSSLARPSEIVSAPNNASAHLLCEQGYAIGVPPPPSSRICALCASLVQLLAQLEAAGLPPQFLFVYNAPWLLLEEQWSSALLTGILGWDSVMEADMNCWALRKPTTPSSSLSPLSFPSSRAPSYIGANFGESHRDQRYSSCHTSDGQPTSLNVWIPFNASGATALNGAMRVLPIPQDAFYFSPTHLAHMDTSISLAQAVTQSAAASAVLECSTGTACVWSPALVHWGGSCSAESPVEPRASIAATFRMKSALPSVFGSGNGGGESSSASATGPPPLVRGDLFSLSLPRRLAYVAKSLLSYSHWHPGFPGIRLAAA